MEPEAIPQQRTVDVLVDDNGNPVEGVPVAMKLTFDNIKFPTLEEVLDKTEPDFDDFDVLRGKMGACDELTEFTKIFYYKVKVDPPVNGKDYRIEELPKYPKFLALFEGKKSVSEITLFDVNRMFNKEQFNESLAEDERNNAISEAAAEIMENMKKENRFSFDAELKESDLEILRKHVKDTDGFTVYSDLLADSFCEILPDFAKIGEGAPVEFNQEGLMFAEEDEGEDDDIGGFMPTPGGWTPYKE